MLSKQVANSDIFSSLGASSKGNGAAKGASDSVLGEFAELLKTEGSLNDISPQDLMKLFTKGLSREANGDADIAQLMSKLSNPQNQELLKSLAFDGESFISAEGQKISPEALVEKLTQGNGELSLGSLNEMSNAKELSQLAKADRASFRNMNQNFPQVTKMKGQMQKPVVGDVQSAEDFLAQRNALFGKSHVNTEAGTPKLQSIRPGLSEYHKESIVTDQRIIRANGEGVEPQVESQSDFQMTEMYEGGGENQLEVQSVQLSKNSDGSEMKMASKNQVLDLSNVNANNKTELINKISNYIEQSYVSGQDTVEMVVKHDDLGHFKVSATRTGLGNNQIDLQINTMTEKGHQFFVENESELIRTLTKSGVKIADIKVTNGQEFIGLSDNRSQMSDNNSQGQGRGEYQSQGQNFREGGQDGSGQERRRQLWKDAREQFMNYQAA